MALTKHQVNDLVAHLIAWYHQTRRPLPKGLAPYSGTVGKVKRRMIVVYQTAHFLHVDGTFNTQTQKSLIPPDPRASKAAKTLAYCQWGVNNRGRFTYAQDRPIHNPAPAELYRLPRVRDCSAFAIDACHVGGFASVTGFPFESGYGNTDSMLSHLPKRPIFALRQADLIVFSNPGHVVVVTATHATDPQGILWLTGDGHQGAPDVTTLNQQIASHHGSYYGLSVD